MPAASCSHAQLQTEPSSWAERAGYQRATAAQRAAAATSHGQVRKAAAHASVDPGTFPAPLVLPDDDLALDPKWPKQSFRSWLREKERNAVTPTRNVVYVAQAPRTSPDLAFMKRWTVPRASTNSQIDPANLAKPITDYCRAFFHGLPVRAFTKRLEFVPWEASHGRSSQTPAWIGLETPTERIGVKTRPCPDDVFARQLSVNDLIDAVISVLPSDAYAMVMLVHQDIYESDEDDFLCGRAYGGSRIAVVSTARYNPDLDSNCGLDLQHTWPASHCAAFVKSEVARYLSKAPKLDPARQSTIDLTHETPLTAAIESYRRSLAGPKPGAQHLEGLWLSRVCRTTSHELGHCFGMDHCVYFACNMQGTAGLPEDVRQPPYLCPICLTKLLHATEADENDRYRALLAFCRKWMHVATFAGYAAWLEAVLG